MTESVVKTEKKIKPFLSFHNEKYEKQTGPYDEQWSYEQRYERINENRNEKIIEGKETEMPNLHKLLNRTEKARSSTMMRQRHARGGIQLNINNFQISFKQLGRYVIQQDNQFNRGSNYS